MMFVVVLIPLVEQVLGLINILDLIGSYFTLTCVEVPIPTDWFETKFKLIKSPLIKSCDFLTPIVECILWSFPVICSKLLSKEYSKLLEPTLVSPTKDNPFVFVVRPTWVTIPM